MFLQLGLRRSFSALKQHAPALQALMRCPRPAMTKCAPIPSIRDSRVLQLLNHRTGLKFPARSFYASAKQSLRYHPPPRQPERTSFLGFLDKIPQKVVLFTILVLNGAVFAVWQVAKQQYKINGDPGLYIWMSQNFLSSWNNVKAGRVWTAITACFSHNDWSHILFNGFTFFFMSPVVLQILGSRKFIVLYLGAGLASCGISLLYGHYIDRKDTPSHGASGAIYGVTTFLACVAPTMTFHLYGVVPVPAWLVITALFSYDTYSTYTNSRGNIDTVGHIGGMLSGALYFLLLRRAGRIRW